MYIHNTYIHLHTCMCINAKFAYQSAYSHTYVWLYAHTHAYMHTCTHAYSHTYVCTYAHTFDALLGRRRADRQPDVSLFSAEDFLSSFNDKINGIRLETAGADPTVYPATDCRLCAMVPVTGTEFRRIILSLAAKSCELDPLPT